MIGFFFIYIKIGFRPELKPIEKEVEVVLRFPEVDPLSPPILQLKEVSFGYSPEKMVLQNIEVGATLDSRICIVSKTTLFINMYCMRK